MLCLVILAILSIFGRAFPSHVCCAASVEIVRLCCLLGGWEGWAEAGEPESKIVARLTGKETPGACDYD